MNTKNNKRRRASQEKIESSFIELLQKKEISKITVSEIIKQTGLNRNTFYANYADIYDLADKIRDRLEKETQELYAEETERAHNSQNYLKLFCHMKDNKNLYKTYFKLGYDKANRDNIYDIDLANKIFDNKHIEYHIEFFKAGFNAIVKKWLDEDCAKSPEEMVEILDSEYRGREL